ncbi:MAG: hypothetical protein NVS9B14_08350 [Candidatus Acidiferrum sp.]
MPSIDYDAARKLLDQEFEHVEKEVLEGREPSAPSSKLLKHFDAVFGSSTQAFREVLLGCLLARLSDSKIDVTKPYVNQGDDSYNGRTLDERVVNPFLHEKRIPSSKGPFLAAFRRSVRFDESTRDGLRDKEGYDSLLFLIRGLKVGIEERVARAVLRYALLRFIRLRNAADIALVNLQRISLEQYGHLIEGLLKTPSGGRFPMMLADATFTTIKRTFNLQWDIKAQGINVADKASGAGADITIKHGTRILMAAEVTERSVDKTRVVSTFQTKIAPQGIEDYLFLVTEEASSEVMRQARRYFSQGHEINFFELKNWILVILATIGSSGRAIFNQVLMEKLSTSEIPAALKVAWNDEIAKLTSV